MTLKTKIKALVTAGKTMIGVSGEAFRTLENSFIVDGNLQRTWLLLSDITKLSELLPVDKCEINLIDERNANIVVGLKFGIMSLKAGGTIRLLESQELKRMVAEAVLTTGTLKKEVESEGERPEVSIIVAVEIEPVSDEKTLVKYRMEFNVEAERLKKIYESILDYKFATLHETFVERFNASLKEV